MHTPQKALQDLLGRCASKTDEILVSLVEHLVTHHPEIKKNLADIDLESQFSLLSKAAHLVQGFDGQRSQLREKLLSFPWDLGGIGSQKEHRVWIRQALISGIEAHLAKELSKPQRKAMIKLYEQVYDLISHPKETKGKTMQHDNVELPKEICESISRTVTLRFKEAVRAKIRECLEHEVDVFSIDQYEEEIKAGVHRAA